MPLPFCSPFHPIKRPFCLALLVLAVLHASSGSSVTSAQTTNEAEALRARVQALEAKTEALQQEVDVLRTGPIPLPQVDQVAPSDASLDAMRAEMSKLTWKKGDFTITPYGRVVVSTVYETERSYPGDIILWAQSPDVQGEDACYVDAKSTRLGLKIGGPSPECCSCAQLGACVEIDFQGQYVTHNKPGLLFRRGFIDMKTDDFYLLAGQEWEVISPLYPGNLNYVPGSGVGNLGYRRAQVRADRYFHTVGGSKLSLQSSLNMDILQDFNSDSTVRADVAGWPVLEARAAWKFARGLTASAKPAEIGVSAHIGEVVYDFLAASGSPADDVTRRTWSFNVDVNVPITERLSFRSEFFTGENLSAYMGGILQGVDKQTHETVRSTGGWFDFGYKWTPKLRSYAGFSLDDPFNQDLTSGRTYNHFYFANLLYDVTDKFMVGVDVSSWKTNWIGMRPGELVRIDFQAQYNF